MLLVPLGIDERHVCRARRTPTPIDVSCPRPTPLSCRVSRLSRTPAGSSPTVSDTTLPSPVAWFKTSLVQSRGGRGGSCVTWWCLCRRRSRGTPPPLRLLHQVMTHQVMTHQVMNLSCADQGQRLKRGWGRRGAGLVLALKFSMFTFRWCVLSSRYRSLNSGIYGLCRGRGTYQTIRLYNCI